MELSLDEINSEVCQAMLDEPITDCIFDMIDADGSGLISFDEALAAHDAIEEEEAAGRSHFAISRNFSNDGKYSASNW